MGQTYDELLMLSIMIIFECHKHILDNMFNKKIIEWEYIWYSDALKKKSEEVYILRRFKEWFGTEVLYNRKKTINRSF